MSNFAEWKVEIEQEYEVWKKVHKVTKSDSAIKDYFLEIIEHGQLRDKQRDLKTEYEEFCEHRKDYEEIIGKNGGRVYDCLVAFINFRVSYEIDIESKFLQTEKVQYEKSSALKKKKNGWVKNAAELAALEMSEDLKEREDFYNALIFAGSLHDELVQGVFNKNAGRWINFCSWINKYYHAFDSWDALSEFCAHYCHNEVGDNFLYVRNLEDVCAYYTILKKESDEYRKGLIIQTRNKIDNKKLEKYSDEQRTATAYMLNIIKNDITGDIDEQSFVNDYLTASDWELIGDTAYEHLTAIKKIFSAYCGDDLGQDDGQTRDYSVLVAEIYDKSFDGLLDDRELRRSLNSYSNLQKEILSRFIKINRINKTQNEDKGEGVQHDKIKQIYNILPTENEDSYFYPEFNKSVRYFAVLAAMLEVKGNYFINPDAVVSEINKFLRECYVRELYKNSYDDFDWFVYQSLEYEMKNGLLSDSCGLNTIIKYLQTE